MSCATSGPAREVLAGCLDDPLLSEVLTEDTLALSVEVEDPEPLNEKGAGKPTNLDALIKCGLGPITIESKLTETFGSCSQVPKNCTGMYGARSDIKTASDANCRLEINDRSRQPRRYWEVMKGISIHNAYPTDAPCPFSGQGYQVMRVIAMAAALAQQADQTQWCAIFAFPFSLTPDSAAVVTKMKFRLLPEFRQNVLMLNYEQLARKLRASDDEISRKLGEFMQVRFEAVK